MTASVRRALRQIKRSKRTSARINAQFSVCWAILAQAIGSCVSRSAYAQYVAARMVARMAELGQQSDAEDFAQLFNQSALRAARANKKAA